MENWQDELDKARAEGFAQGYKDGVTKGYSEGVQDANTHRSIGYLAHMHDMMDEIEREPMITAFELHTRLRPIERVRLIRPQLHG